MLLLSSTNSEFHRIKALSVPPVSARRRHLHSLESQSRCAEVRPSSGVSVAARRLNRCRCRNAVAGGSGHCWTLGGDVGTKGGTVAERLLSELTGCGGDVGGRPGRLLLVAVSGASLCGGAFSSPFSFFWKAGGNSYPAEKKSRETSEKGFPSTMEPRTAGSVSRAPDARGSPRGTGLVTAGIAPQLCFS